MAFITSVNGKIITSIVLAIATMLIFGVNHYSILVWLHVLAGIIWIGLLYYFNFVQIPAAATASADTEGPGPAAISKYVAPLALLWFRMAAAATWVLGLVLLEVLGVGIITAFTFGKGAAMIGLGSWLGTIMAFNVWFIIWPNQQKILGLVKVNESLIPAAKKNALLASSINVILSAPMLLSMLAYRL